jgi:hypothetical protein
MYMPLFWKAILGTFAFIINCFPVDHASAHQIQVYNGRTIDEVNNAQNFMEFAFGIATKNAKTVYIYTLPSCLHCLDFLTKDLPEFLEKNKNVNVVVRLIIRSAKDIFIIKLIQSKARSKTEFYLILLAYLRKVRDNMESTKPTAEDVEKYIGSATDELMIKYQLIAIKFGFGKDDVIKAYPDTEGVIEKAILAYYQIFVSEIAKCIPEGNKIDLPLIIQDNQKKDKLNG